MRILPSVSVGLFALVALTACDDSTGTGRVLRLGGTLDADGSASVILPAEAGNIQNVPSLSCYTADPDASLSERVWFQVASVQLPSGVVPDDEAVLDNCLLETYQGDPNRLVATIEGQPSGWLYQFVVVY
ncbi:MAG TPA: hypothetical protein VFS08_18255 [Gemmatimonadaceae bacterium]|nr:hypothetical protein [Gemmatimonadaceae bacterium]